jgi:hypothetical protein
MKVFNVVFVTVSLVWVALATQIGNVAPFPGKLRDCPTFPLMVSPTYG